MQKLNRTLLIKNWQSNTIVYYDTWSSADKVCVSSQTKHNRYITIFTDRPISFLPVHFFLTEMEDFPMTQIRQTTPPVELDGYARTRIIWAGIRNE